MVDVQQKVIVEASKTAVAEIAPGIWRIENPIPPSAGAFANGFSFNQFLIVDDEPLLWQTGLKNMFPQVKAAVDFILRDKGGSKSVKYIWFSHVEADECGSLSDWLNEAPQALVVCSKTAEFVSTTDLANGRVRSLAEGESLSLGKTHTVTWYDTPHVPHGWESGCLLETSTKTLLCGDLFTQMSTPTKVLTTNLDDIMKNVIDIGDWSQNPNTGQILSKLGNLHPTYLAPMHGICFKGDCKAALEKLAEVKIAKQN